MWGPNPSPLREKQELGVSFPLYGTVVKARLTARVCQLFLPILMHFLSWLLDFYQKLTGSHVAYNQCVCQIREVHSQYSRLSGPSINKSLKSPLPNICSCVRARTKSQTSARTWQALAYCHPPTAASTKLPSPTLLHTPGIFAAPQRSQAQSPLGCRSFLCLCGKGNQCLHLPILLPHFIQVCSSRFVTGLP